MRRGQEKMAPECVAVCCIWRAWRGREDVKRMLCEWVARLSMGDAFRIPFRGLTLLPFHLLVFASLSASWYHSSRLPSLVARQFPGLSGGGQRPRAGAQQPVICVVSESPYPQALVHFFYFCCRILIPALCCSSRSWSLSSGVCPLAYICFQGVKLAFICGTHIWCDSISIIV
jgi:hypothetical protein